MTFKFYMDNPYIRELEAEVVEKKFINNKYYIKLDRTIFYPHLAGGQPGDIGTINGIDVIETYEDKDDIVHVLNNNISGKKVKLSIDWDNRLDLMQQHTGQHLLSSVINMLYNSETIGFNIGKEYVHIDINVSNLTDEDVTKIEVLANRMIYSNFKIMCYYVTNEKLKNIPIRNKPKINNDIRIVEIDGFDYSPCCGTHLRQTGEIGIIKIRKWEKKKGNVRIEFVCGNRALIDYIWKNKYIKDIGLLLSSKDKDVLEKVEKLFNTKETLEKENRELRAQLYELKGDSLYNEVKFKDNIGFIYKEIDNMDFKELGFIANYLNAKGNLIQIYGLHNDKKGQLYISSSKNLDLDLLKIFKTLSDKYGIKGGGSPNTVQGGCKINDLPVIMKDFAEYISKEIKVRKS
ncbi:DHHA1 domain-containing protein [Tissierella sp. Yu-01]|uniref:alanyl-tRNA editing protein n=1 Tax=Tissierella sp. Yu-01 TaxID=3035694 RepID=UPI00240E5693|nr:DHHA1 domain-containing protein [Tissierella sp. Yu-01]WFA09526.1 DHHA1 domain-containing protein [Tissierella sp. Yu-01]